MTLRLPASLADQQPGTGRLALVGARLFDGTGAPVRDRVTVLLRDGRVDQVIDAEQGLPADLPADLQQVDLAGRFLMPGLVDVHAHLSILESAGRFPRPACICSGHGLPSDSACANAIAATSGSASSRAMARSTAAAANTIVSSSSRST